MQRVAVLLGLGLVAATAGAGARVQSSCEFEGIDRIVAVGDVHGAYDQLVALLETAGVIDNRQRWHAGRAHLVQLGDVLDRGPDSRKVLDLYRRLGREASSAGGRLHFLIGNHEALRLIGDYRYVDPGEYKAFATGSSATLRSNFVDAVEDPVLKKHFASQPLGAIELIRAFGANETYGSYLRGLNAVVRINSVVLLHGGISPAVAAMPCGEINATIRKELSPDELKTTITTPAASLAFREDGPLWYRGLATESELLPGQVDEILKAQQARAIVVAHTPQVTSRIGVLYEGKVFAIDTGMQPAYVPEGRPAALEIRSGVFTAIYMDRREVLLQVQADAAVAR
jgi:Calcineurin-like phosphoesterase